MKFSMHFIFAISIMGALVSQFTKASADEIPGYIGQQSFRLNDDPELYNLSRRADGAKVEVARIDQIRSQIADQVNHLARERDALVGRMNELQKNIDAHKENKNSLQAKLEELNKAPEANKDQISQIKSEIESVTQKIGDLSKQYGASKMELAPINVRLDQAQHDLAIATQNTQNAMARLNQIVRERESYRQDLIASIQMINKEGANRGRVDGSSDGAGLSKRLGQDTGVRDGEKDGLNQGTTDGQNKYYRRGADQGERDGSARAHLEGSRDGTNEGTTNGNSSAGSREGRIAGLKRGDASNAAEVGIQQGKKAGLEHAVRNGSIDGNNIGESETVQKYEAGELNSITINGPFAGSFQRRSPGYPGDFNGPSFNPSVYNSRDVMKRAYADGYVDQYRDYTRYEFLRRIDTDYNQAYDYRYAATYDQAANREYPEYFERGRIEADARAYSRDYPIAKEEAYKLAFEQANANPTRSTEAYKSSYKRSELEAFNERYEQIRRASFDRVELETYNANIAAQTEIYRQKRIGEVTAVYKNNAVLSFVNSEMKDGGISGVAKLDGVFQPGETTLHSITLRNFGMKAAQKVSVQLDNGASVSLPVIPARSIVVVKGAGVSKIATNAAIGSTVRTSLKVQSKLTSDDAVEGIHYDSIGGGVLKNADHKSARIAYPLTLANLSLGSQLLKNVANTLSVTVTNNSSRPYAGEMKVEVLVNSQTQVVTKEFGAISSLQSMATLSDAEVTIVSDADIYRDLDFSATISQNGVTLGVLGTDLVAMAKAQYAEKANAPVIVANSDKNLKELLDALALLGGTEKASVLDLSLGLNAGILANGLNQKVLLISDDEKGSNIATLNTFIAKSKSSAFVFIDEFSTGLKNVLNLGSLRDAQKLLWDKKPVVFTNPHRADGVLKSSAMIQSSLKTFVQDMTLASDLTRSATELLARFNAEINRSSFFTPNNAIKMYSFKAMAEVLCINKAYDESGKIFSRDKKWAVMIANDGSLFINVLKGASAGDVTEAKLANVLPAIALKDTISNAMSYAEGIYGVMMPKIKNATNKVLDDMEDGFKKSLKNFDKDLYNQSYGKAHIHRPFFIIPTPGFAGL